MPERLIVLITSLDGYAAAEGSLSLRETDPLTPGAAAALPVRAARPDDPEPVVHALLDAFGEAVVVPCAVGSRYVF